MVTQVLYFIQQTTNSWYVFGPDLYLAIVKEHATVHIIIQCLEMLWFFCLQIQQASDLLQKYVLLPTVAVVAIFHSFFFKDKTVLLKVPLLQQPIHWLQV